MAVKKRKTLFTKGKKKKGQDWEAKGNINDFQDAGKGKETWVSDRRERIKDWTLLKA